MRSALSMNNNQKFSFTCQVFVGCQSKALLHPPSLQVFSLNVTLWCAGIAFVTVVAWIPGHAASYLGASSTMPGALLVSLQRRTRARQATLVPVGALNPRKCSFLICTRRMHPALRRCMGAARDL